jgi:acyl transferase domain-containing protein/NAD(P)H-dependent flavin oxidoreductase YrpB (nitropropane dioxygenase family)/NAD(P)-dependent dehydrogenase (short-subunit alcohol dehydrogenase family)
MFEFTKFVFTPAGYADAALAIAACRAGGVGVLNGELASNSAAVVAALDQLAANARAPYGLKLDALSDGLAAAARAHANQDLKWLIVDAEILSACEALIADVRRAGVRVLAEVKSADWPASALASCDGLLIKGNESGGFVGEDSSFILLQKWRQRTRLPLYVRGGITPHVAAACATIGVAGGVLDSQLLLMDEVRLPDALRTLLGNLSGSETIAVGHGEAGEYFRLLVRPGLVAARQFVELGYGLRYDELRPHIVGRALWQSAAAALLPIGQDVVFAAAWRKRFGCVAAVLRAIDLAIEGHVRIAQQYLSIGEGAPLARAMGVRFPIIQGPMTRVSDTAEFARAVAAGGALPMVAFAVLKGAPLEQLLRRTSEMLDERPWGIGLLGFAPQELLDEQLAIAARFAPDYAIIAGGRPDQAVHLEQAGVPTFLHVPSANLIPTFLLEGARRFIFEGRECGGHIGPLSSFVLWSSIVDRVLAELAPCKVRGEELELVFAGGIHDDISSAMLQVMTAPLAAVGAKVGILMGSAYLFTKEIVSSGSIVEQFQQEALACERTVNLESGVGHASRCAYTPFARDFFRQRSEMLRSGIPADEGRRLLDELILGRLRIASKGRKRDAANGALRDLEAALQHEEGMYMLGQVATLRNRVTNIQALHDEVTVGAATLLTQCLQRSQDSLPQPERALPADIAIVGIACVLPKANTTREYWDNILAKVDAITEIPTHRWDWRLYFDADRDTKDKIYSKWGGFLDDLAFDPTKYGMPPKSIESVDPMQLMGLEVAQRTLVDAGYHEKPFDRERASVIIGASGGIGDFGMQYGLRSELPRFSGDLPHDLAARLPEWTEDSFAGILPNVAAGRIANRLNFGGMNITTDAACASSLAAIYQGVTELTAGRSDFVIAGGLDTVQGPFGYLCFSKTQALSPRGKCSTFDTGGDGIVISEGIAMVALKRLADATRDGDRIYGVIKGVGASSDGSAKGMTAPLPAGQLRAMHRAYAMAGFGPSSVGLFEAHGTGTVAGDTAELESTTRLMHEEGASPHQAVIGSVKTMIGHTKATAGAAGLVKAVLALHHRVLPPHTNVTSPNSMLVDPAAPLYLLDEPMPWFAPSGAPRRAACSAFGFGGTNFHVVLEEYAAEYRDWLRPPASDAWGAELLVWTESDRAALMSRIASFQVAIADLDGLLMRDVAASLAARFSPVGQTLAIVARSTRDLRAKLGAALGYLRGESKALPPGVFHGEAVEPAGKLAVLFSGQGSQYPNMVREVALHFDTVSGALSDADQVLGDAFAARFGAASSLTKFIFPRGAYDESAISDARQRLASTDVAQPALGAVEVGLFRLLSSLGLTAHMFAGHSYGEFVALHAAGAIEFDSLMQISAARGRFIVDAARAEGAELGTMAVVNAPRKVVEDAIAEIDGVILANHNAPLQSVISGTRAAVKAAAAKLLEAGVEVTEIAVAAAFHSDLVKPAQQALSDLIDITPWSPTTTPVYSNTTARAHAADPALVKRQMAEHLVRPVEFVAEVETMYEDGARIFVEVGPKAVLARLVSRIVDGRPHVAVAVDDGSGLAGLLGSVGQLLCAGVKLDIARLFRRRDCRIGDPMQPATLLRVELVSKHAWMINGSGARRAAEPVRQIGVTLEQARSAPRVEALLVAAASPTVASALAAPATAAPSPVQTQQTNTAHESSASTKHAFRKDGPMDVRRNDPGMAESSVMSEYFETMRQFLETQERVMSAFLGGAGAMRSPTRARALPMNLPRMAELAAAPLVVPVAKQHVPVVAAAAAPQTAEPVAVPKAAAPTEVPAAAVTKTAAASLAPKANGAGLTREKLRDALLGIVEEKTGYPPDMLGLDQNLEADLGIDSIKRVEVVGALLKLLPDGYREALTQSRSKLNTQSTLNGMLDLITQANVGGAVAVPFDSAGVVAKADVVSQPPRLVMRARREPLVPTMGRRLTPGLFVLTRDTLGVADTLAQSLRVRGAEVLIVGADVLSVDSLLLKFCQGIDAASPLAGVVHLAAIGSAPLSGREGPAEWRAAIQVNEKSFFLLLRELNARLTPGAHVLAASDLGGLFGRNGSAPGALRLQGGASGAIKSLFEERGDLRVKAIDLDPGRSASELSADLLAEIELDGGRQEVGYPAGQRTIFATVGEEVTPDPTREANLANLVVLATGGARGITAEVLRELAVPGNTLVLTGRSRVPEKEPEDYAQLADADGLRKYFVAQVRAGILKLTPGEVQRRVQSVLDLREMRANLADFRAAGAAVEYHSVDVTDESAIGSLIEDVKRRHGRIDGVVHGAGVIEDKLLADKQSDSWSRVVETKVIGLMLLQKHVDPSELKFFTVFSSVAGRYGNSGQSDYATANELMNRVCVSLQARWGNRVAVSALCWGPWGSTKFGAGMVTPETEVKFEKRGVLLVSAVLGRRLFRQELARSDGTAVEVICGQGPWESHEAERGVIRPAANIEAEGAATRLADDAPELRPLLGNAEVHTRPSGEKVLPVRLDSARHLYLQEHVIDGKMVLPAAVALELMAEAARTLWPRWCVVAVQELRVLKNVELERGTCDVQVHLSPPPYGSSEGFEVSAALKTEAGAGRLQTHFQCVVRMEHSLPATAPAGRAVHKDKSLTVPKAYDEWLSHGPRLQVIENIDGLSAAGAGAQVRATQPYEWLSLGNGNGSRWLFDPALLVAATQIVSLWARAYRDESVLPIRYGRVVRYRDAFPAHVHMEFERADSPDAAMIRGNVVFFDDQNEPVLAIEELDCVATATLNRVGGKARAAERAVA